MPSDKHNLITAKATGLIMSLFDVASAAVCIVHFSRSNQCPPLCSIHDRESVDLLVAYDSFLYAKEIIIFYKRYFSNSS